MLEYLFVINSRCFQLHARKNGRGGGVGRWKGLRILGPDPSGSFLRETLRVIVCEGGRELREMLG